MSYPHSRKEKILVQSCKVLAALILMCCRPGLHHTCLLFSSFLGLRRTLFYRVSSVTRVNKTEQPLEIKEQMTNVNSEQQQLRGLQCSLASALMSLCWQPSSPRLDSRWRTTELSCYLTLLLNKGRQYCMDSKWEGRLSLLNVADK